MLIITIYEKFQVVHSSNSFWLSSTKVTCSEEADLLSSDSFGKFCALRLLGIQTAAESNAFENNGDHAESSLSNYS